MSLIHWWPLNGDTKDRVTNTQLTNNGATIINSGKIGQCYTFNGSTNLTISYPSLNTLGSNPAKFSFAFWVKLNSTWAGWGQVFTIGRNGGAWTDIRIGFDIASDKTGYFTISDGSTATSYNGPKHVLTVGIWHHVAATFDNKEMKLFINGQPASTSQATASVLPSFSSDTIIAIGGNSSEKGECDMNDVRIYDHALSQAEVKELSKALVVHYTFDDMCAEPTTNVSTINGWNSYTPYFVISERTKTGLKVYRPSSSTSNVLALNNSAVTGNMTAGDIWTFSCFLYVDGKPYKCTQSDMSTYNYSGISYYSNDDGYYTCTFRVGSPETWIIHASMFGDVGTNVMCEIDRIQFEKKDHATPYTPTSRSSMLCNETGLTQPNTSDNISLTTDSTSGILSLKCQGNTQIICTNTGDVTQGVTVSCWVKCSIPSDSRLIFADNNSKIAFGFFNNGQAIITCAGYGHACVSNVRTNWNAEWNHIIVRKASNNVVDCYINGIKQNLSGSQEWTHSSTNSLSIGCRYSGGWTSHFTGLIDDFRFYNTCLSDSDILDLYKTKAYITDKGDIVSGKFIEDKAQAQVTSKYNFECREIMENLDSSYQRLEYIASTGAQYIDTGYYWTSEAGTIVADLMITSNSSSQTVFGNEERYSGSTRYFAHILHGTNGNFSNYIGAGATGTNSVLTLNNRYVFEYITHGNNKFTTRRTSTSGVVTVYNNQVNYSGSIRTKAHTTSSTSNAGNIFIFSNHNGYNGTGPIQNIGGMRLYRFTMLDNNVMVRDFVPVKRLSDNVAGLFDLVEGKFYTTPTGSFTASSAINEGVQAKIHQDNSISGREIIEI